MISIESGVLRIFPLYKPKPALITVLSPRKYFGLILSVAFTSIAIRGAQEQHYETEMDLPGTEMRLIYKLISS